MKRYERGEREISMVFSNSSKSKRKWKIHETVRNRSGNGLKKMDFWFPTAEMKPHVQGMKNTIRSGGLIIRSGEFKKSNPR